MLRRWLLVVALLGGPAAGACHAESYDASRLPEGLRSDYAVFAQRCSRCHSLARPLSASIDSDVFWGRYVEQMRLKPGSGISSADTAPILRFLHYHMLERRRSEPQAPSATASTSAPFPVPASDGGAPP